MIENADRNSYAGMLKGKTVIVALTASISIYRMPDVVRDLRREGASVIVGMSREAASMLSPDVMEWASGNNVVTKLTGDIEHITLFASPEDTSLLIAPCTHNTMGKAANGISDDVPSAFFSFAIGHGNPVVMAPAMHEGMYRNPANLRNVKFLEEAGAIIVPPEMAEEKAKLSLGSDIVDYVCRSFYGNMLSGKRILVIGGHTEEAIDPVRSITNHGTGFSGYWLARMAYRMGAEVEYMGNFTGTLPSYVKFTGTVSSDDLASALKELDMGSFDAVMVPAAISDYRVKNRSREKLSSGGKHTLELEPSEKMLDIISEGFNGQLVPFSLTESLDPEALREKFSKYRTAMVVSNSFSAGSPFGTVENSYTIVSGNRVWMLEDVSKAEMSLNVLRQLSEMLAR